MNGARQAEATSLDAHAGRAGLFVSSSETKRVQFFLRVISPTFFTHAWPLWVKYSLTFLFTLAILGLRMIAQPYIGNFPVVFFFISVIVCSLIFDHGSGILAACLGALGGIYVAITNDFPDTIWFGISLAFVIMLVIATLIESLQETAHQLMIRNATLIKAEHDKDLLIRENAHRVRNDLTIFSSMIRLQQARLRDDAARSALGSLNDRLLVLLRVHQRLRIGIGATSAVDAKVFLQDLCDELRTSLIGNQPLTLTFDAQTHWITHKAAVSLGLILNELVTNALKYAYAGTGHGGAFGEVRVRFWRDDQSFVLTVEDDGLGDDGSIKGTGLGGKLVKAMASQLEGAIVMDSKPGEGLRATLTFSASDTAAGVTSVF